MLGSGRFSVDSGRLRLLYNLHTDCFLIFMLVDRRLLLSIKLEHVILMWWIPNQAGFSGQITPPRFLAEFSTEKV